jgi:hypothetical protein
MPKATSRRNTSDPHPITVLPFVHDATPGADDAGRNFWHVAGTGDYGLDCELGTGMAHRAIAYMRENNVPHLLTWVVESMIERGDFSGIEVGFLQTIASAAIKGYQQ